MPQKINVGNSGSDIPGSTFNPNSNKNSKSNASDATAEETGLPIPNPLDVYASYNYIVTLCVLTNEEINNPWDTYRIKTPENIVLRSGGWQNTPALLNTDAWDNKLEYYIDNLAIESIVSATEITKHTNATNIEFDVIEPYGLGTFIETLMKASENAGHSNHLSAPHLMIIDFIGWDDNGKSVNHIDSGLRRTIPYKLSNVTFNVNEAGSTYKVYAYPWNEQATQTQTFSLKGDRKIRGRTVKECCQSGLYSVSSAFNSREQKAKIQDPSYVPDEYLIIFPKEEDITDMIKKIKLTGTSGNAETIDPAFTGGMHVETGRRNLSEEEENRLWDSGESSAIKKRRSFRGELDAKESVIIKRSNEGEKARKYADAAENNNDIGSAKIVKEPQDQVKHPLMAPIFAELNDTRDGIFDRSRLKISDDIAEFSFKAGTTIEAMIEEIILMSEYGRKMLDQEPDKNGMLKWFRIETYVLNIANSTKQKTEGRDAHVYIYKVIPYQTHKSRFTPVTNVVDLTALQDQCIKQYDYIYTGKNDAILNFNIQIDSAFFVAVNATHTGKYGSKTRKSDSRGKQTAPTGIVQTEGQGVTSVNGHRGTQIVEKNTTSNQGGGHHEDEHTVAARNFNDVYLSGGVDLINVTLTIMGDPYFIMDSGTGNYQAEPGEYINISKDGTMYIHNGEVDIKINFKTPIDYKYNGEGKGDGDGHLTFDDAFATTPYSGVYQVIQVTNYFREGQFTQDLQLVRRPMQQDLDTKEAPTKDEKMISSSGVRKKFNEDSYIANYTGGYLL